MEKILPRYLEMVKGLEEITQLFAGKMEKMGAAHTHFLSIKLEAEKGSLRSKILDEIGPLRAATAAESLGVSDFTFEALLAEVDRFATEEEDGSEVDAGKGGGGDGSRGQMADGKAAGDCEN